MRVTLDSLLRDPQLALPPNWSECVVVFSHDQSFELEKIRECMERLQKHYHVELDCVYMQAATFTISR